MRLLEYDASLPDQVSKDEMFSPSETKTGLKTEKNTEKIKRVKDGRKCFI